MRGLSTERATAAEPGFTPTGHTAWPVSGSTAKAEGSHVWKSAGVKAVFAVDAGGCGCSFAETGPGGAAGREGPRSGGTGTAGDVAAGRGGGPNMGRSGWLRPARIRAVKVVPGGTSPRREYAPLRPSSMRRANGPVAR